MLLVSFAINGYFWLFMAINLAAVWPVSRTGPNTPPGGLAGAYLHPIYMYITVYIYIGYYYSDYYHQLLIIIIDIIINYG